MIRQNFQLASQSHAAMTHPHFEVRGHSTQKIPWGLCTGSKLFLDRLNFLGGSTRKEGARFEIRSFWSSVYNISSGEITAASIMRFPHYAMYRITTTVSKIQAPSRTNDSVIAIKIGVHRAIWKLSWKSLVEQVAATWVASRYIKWSL